MRPLIDAAGNVVPTDPCRCGRPKLASKNVCCATCFLDKHMTGCSIRCAAMDVPGFGVKASPLPRRSRYIAVPETGYERKQRDRNVRRDAKHNSSL